MGLGKSQCGTGEGLRGRAGLGIRGFNTEGAEVGAQRAQREEGVGYACRLEAGATTEERKKKPHPENRPFGFAQGRQGAAPTKMPERWWKLLGGFGLYLVEGEG